MFSYFNLIIALIVYIYHNRIQAKGETEVENEHFNDEYSEFPNYRSSYESPQCSMEVPCHLLTGPLRTIRALLNELETVSKVHCSKIADVPDRVILNSSVMKRKNQMPSKHPNMPKRFAYQKSGPPTSLFFSENSRAAYSHRTPINKMNPFYHNNRENTRKTNFNKMMLADPLNNDDGRRNKKKVRPCAKKPNKDRKNLKISNRMNVYDDVKENSNDEPTEINIDIESTSKSSSTDTNVQDEKLI